MADQVDSPHRRFDRRLVAQVAVAELDAVGQPGTLPAGMRRGEQGVQYPHVVAGPDERLDHAAADEPGAAGDQYPHHATRPTKPMK